METALETKVKLFPTKLGILLLSCLVLFGCGQMPQQAEMSGNVSSNESTLVLVTGITGNQGGGVADALLDQGFQVRGLSRDISSDASQALIARGVEMVQGDFHDPNSITAAVDGIDHLFINITEQTPNFINAANHAIDVAYTAGAQHIVFTSNIPADTHLGFDVNPTGTKRAIELHLRASGGSYSTLRIPFMMENLMRERGMQDMLNTGVVEYGEDNTYGYYISSGDMGLLAAAAFSDPQGWNGREVNMASDAVSSRELVALISELSGKEIAYRVAPWSEMRGRFVPNFQFFETLDRSDYDIDEIRAEFPEMQTLREYLISQNYGEKISALAQGIQ